MNELTLAIIAGAFALLIALFAFIKLRTTQAVFRQTRSDFDATIAQLHEQTQKALDQARNAAAAEAKLESSQKRVEELTEQLDLAQRTKEEAVRATAEANQNAALAVQAIEDMQKRINDWETLKEQNKEAAKAAMLEASTTLSNKLIEDHKRETSEAKKEGEAEVKKTKEDFAQRVSEIATVVAALQSHLEENKTTVATVVRVLSNPGSAGQSAEIGLENTLKSFGLERGRDFVMQLSVTDGETSKRLRPDAVVFLPSESVLVVDSKASKFLYDIAKAEGGGDEQAAYDRFASTMNTHLKSLSEKDYKNAIVEAYARSGRQGDVRRVMSVMALPSDSALEKLYRADPDFPKKAAERQIIPVGPAGLSCIVGFARVEIDTGRQIDNQEKIIRSVQRLLDGIAVSLGHALSIGTSIKGAADNFAKFAASVNKTLLPRAQALPQLGVRSEKALPMSLPAIQVIGLETHTTIEAEAEDDGGMALPQPKQ